MTADSRKKVERTEPYSSLSSSSDSESVPAGVKSGGAVVLLSLRLRRKQGPTLLSRAGGAAEDCLLRLLFIRREARLDRRLIRFPFVGGGVGTGAAMPLAASATGLCVPVQLCAREVTLVLRERIDSGS